MNNKGQSLVTFVVLLPVILLVLACSIDLGYIAIEKNKLNDINKTMVKYLVKDGRDRGTIKEIVIKNDKNIEIDKISNNRIVLSKDINSIFGKVINLKTYKIVSNVSGKMENGKLVIEKGK